MFFPTHDGLFAEKDVDNRNVPLPRVVVGVLLKLREQQGFLARQSHRASCHK